MLEHLDVGPSLLFFSTGHFIDDLDDTVDEQDEEEDCHQNGDVGIGDRCWIFWGNISISNCADGLEAPIGSIVEPHVPRVDLDDVEGKELAGLGDTSCALFIGQPIVDSCVLSVFVVTVVDSKENG